MVFPLREKCSNTFFSGPYLDTFHIVLLSKKRTYNDQNILQVALFFFKRNHPLPLKESAVKYLFSSVYVVGIACFHKCFLFHVITGRHYYSCDPIVTLWFPSTAIWLSFLKQVFWNMEIYISMFERITVLIPKIKCKDVACYTKYTELRQDWHFHKK